MACAVSNICMDQDMEQIVLGCQRHESQAQKRLYDAMAPQMMGLCMRYVSCREEAQDILHEGFISVFEHINELENVQSLQSWMGRIMVNRTINYVTRNNRLVYCDLDNMPPVTAEADEELDTDRFCLSDVLSAIGQLPDIYRLAFNMHDVESVSYEDMSKTLGQPVVTIRSTVSRARQMLRDILTKEIKNEKNQDTI